ncbi:MAG: argininosuccinate lyase [Parcubacteria group bacterium]|jgi:argininosuccinate lyase
MKEINNLWGSAFKEKPSEEAINFCAGRDVRSIKPADYNLIPYDIWCNKAHVVMLSEKKIIPKKDARLILEGLRELEGLFSQGKFILDPSKEDVHTYIESWLIDKYGIEAAGKIHTARARNDQSNLDMRLYVRDNVLHFVEQILELSQVLNKLVVKYGDYVMPGFTHHQHAMITSFGHVLASFSSMLIRDAKRFTAWFELHNKNPLGNVASYGTSFPIDRKLTADFFAFSGVEPNSLDEISNRWESEADLGFSVNVLMNHLSHIAQTFIIFSMPEFGFISLPDTFSTGSSIMPQKKNPDPLEVIKGKTSLVSGLQQGLISMGKGGFIGYNRDNQWSKYIIMDLVEESALAPKIVSGFLSSMQVNKNKLEEWSKKGFVGVTSFLEQFAKRFKLPFRKAKIVVEKAIKYSSDRDNITHAALLKSLKEEGLKLNVTKKQVNDWQNPKNILKNTISIGGPGKKSLRESVKEFEAELKLLRSWVKNKREKREKAINSLNDRIHQILEK